MKLVTVTSPDPNNPERIGLVVEPHPQAPHRAFAQLAEGSDWHEMTPNGALAGGVYPTRKGVGQKLEHLALAWKLGRAQAGMSHVPTNSASNGPQSRAPSDAQGSLMAVLGAMLAQAARGSGGPNPPLHAAPGAALLVGQRPAPQAGEPDPFGDMEGDSVAVDFETSTLKGWDALDAELSPPQLPAAEPAVDGADVRKDCDEFDQSLADLTAHLDEARYRAGGL